MTTLAGRPNTAAVIIDVQNDVVGEAFRRDEVVANVAALVDHARAAAVPVVWVMDTGDTHPVGSDAWQLAAPLSRRDGEAVVRKEYGDAFESTDLEDVLAGLGVGHLVVAGAQTDECIRCTIHGAGVRGYDVTLVGDAHTTEDYSRYGAPTPDKVIAHTNLYWDDHKTPGRRNAVRDVAAVDFTPPV